MKYSYILLILIVFTSCKSDERNNQITNPEDYNSFLVSSNTKTFTRAFSEKEFWSSRLRPDSTGVGDLGPLANAYTLLFETTGDIKYLKSSAKIYKKAIAISAHSKDSYARSLAKNYINQHRFHEAQQILEQTFKGVSSKRATKMLMFDAYLELGAYAKADKILGELKNSNDYNYLIRLAKWNDHNGDLGAAIRNLEEAKNIADSRKSNFLQIQVYASLADFYGRAGRIKDSYNLYLKTLKIQADNVYAKKKIAWIAYSYDKNTQEASRILDSILINNNTPEYYLFKSKISKFNGAIPESNDLENKFVNTVNNGDYGNIYNACLIEIYSEMNPEKALEIATDEIKNRATPETYSLLAYAQLRVGEKEKSLATISSFVEGKTFKPKSLYYSALVYKANNLNDKVELIKANLKKASFELGPIIALKLNTL